MSSEELWGVALQRFFWRRDFSYWRVWEVRELVRSLGARVKIIEGYLEGDMTVVLRG